MRSVTAARVAAPTLLDVIPRSDRRERVGGEQRLAEPPTSGPPLQVSGPRPQTEVRYRAGALAPLFVPWESWISVSASSTGCACLRSFHASTSPSRALLSCARTNTSWWSCTRWKASVGGRPTVHIDVSLELWTKGTRRIAVLELRDAAAVRQLLKDRREPFSPLTLEPGTPKVSADFTLEPADGATLQGGEGSRLMFGLRLDRNGRDRRVSLKVGAPR
jgi:hypothetical protein